MAPETEREIRISQLLDELLEYLRAGHSPDVAAWKARYPDLADEIPSLLDTLRDLDSVLECWKAPSGSSVEPPTRVDGKDEQHLTVVMEPLPERIGRYRILRRVGSGGMGTVYQAHDPELDRVVAVKVPRFDVDPDHLPVRIQRFLREARAAARIEHPNVCHIHDVGEQDGRPYVVMAYVDGSSLADILRHEPARYQDPAEAVRLCRDVAEALEAVHAYGTIHRDLKPGNILIDRGGRALLTDFGLARVERDPENLSADGALIGTPAYMPPEQAAGESEAIGPQSDVYSLGVVLYRLLTGKLPFSGSAVRILWKIGNEKPPAPSTLRQGLDPGLESIVLKAMAPDPADRYHSARQFREALDGWLGDASTISGIQSGERAALKTALSDHPTATFDRPQLGKRQGKAPRRFPLSVAVAAGVVLAGGLLSAALLGMMRSKERDEPRMATPRPIAPGEPLSRLALVKHPRPMKDARSWTLEMRGHRGSINCVAYSPDGTLVATAGNDGSVRVWETNSGRLARILLGHDNNVTSLTWSPDGKNLASASWDQTVRVWDIPSGRHLFNVVNFLYQVNQIAWSPDGKFIALTEQDGRVQLWDCVAGKTALTFEGSGAEGKVIAWSPDGRRLATGGLDRVVRLWEIGSRPHQPPKVFEGHSNVNALAWSPDGKTLASGGEDGTVRFWNVDAGSELHPPEAKPGAVDALAWSVDGTTVAAARGGGWIELLGADSGRKVLEFKAHEGKITALAWSPDGQSLASAGPNGDRYAVRLWEAKSDREVRHIDAYPNFAYKGVAWSPDGKVVAAGGKDGLCLWKTSPAQLLTILPDPECYTMAVAWSPDGKQLASAGWKQAGISLWKGHEVPDHLDRTFTPEAVVSVLAWSPHGDLLASAGSPRVQLWEVPAGRLARTLHGHIGVVAALAWSPNGKRLASGAGTPDGRLMVWDAASGKALHTLGQKGGCLASVSWSSDGKLLAAGGTKDLIETWDPDNGTSLRTIKGTKPVRALAFSPDAKLLANSGYDDAVQIWKADGRSAGLFQVGTGSAYCLAWSPDNKVLATNGPDGMLGFWDHAKGEPLAFVVPGPDGSGVAISPYGNYTCKAAIERDLVYIVQTDRGQEILTPDEFSMRYGWKNDSTRIHLTG